jgi:hypothetical protein
VAVFANRAIPPTLSFNVEIGWPDCPTGRIAMAEEHDKSVEADRKRTAEADRLIPRSESAIERANKAIRANQELLDRLKAERKVRRRKPRR